MASKLLKVDELRDELSKRGLSTAGIKPTLVKRLESAIRKESLPPSSNRLEKRERYADIFLEEEREEASVDGDFNCKIRAVGELRSLNIKQLRERASLIGVSASGSKKQLIERLCEDSQTKNENILEEEEDTNESKQVQLVTATKKGSAVLDSWIPDHVKSHYHVLQQGDEIYDATLNQTNVGENNNKFYIIQALGHIPIPFLFSAYRSLLITRESDDGSTFMVYNRWGRVGQKGQDKLHGPYTCAQSAVDEFEQKFYGKTKNHWLDRKDFVSHPRLYTWLEMDYSEAGKETVVQEKPGSKMEIQPRETKLEARVAKFISLICNISMMKQQMMEIGYNAEKLPLGKLSKATISKGYEVLKKVADVMGQYDRKKLEQLSGEFYTVIPHDFGFRKMRKCLCISLTFGTLLNLYLRICGFMESFVNLIVYTSTGEFVIDTPQKLKRKLEMVEALGEIEVATKLLEDSAGMQEDPLFSHYQRLNCELTPVDVDSKEFHMITKYMRNTHAKTHSDYSVEIVQIFRTSRHGEADRFKKFSDTKNRMLLWHGSRLTNWTGILSQGLRIAPPEAPVTGYMFGKGVYFADMFSKSANYCCASIHTTAGVLLLCEVALGDVAELLRADYNADKLPQGKLSTKGVGATAPDMSESEILEDGLVVPLGRPKQQLDSKASSLLYNEYIAYNVEQIRMRYLVHVNFNFNR
ncbi:hypothetical protein OSB04_022825 [Centaurea solstitialis]|uniref:Poly [ADP-ribose] polymerase n=1 Tax=Centaurea solstitialis TaxID=347529 RepID=A0AA38SIQ6_9ASTR|nr:hypothetical protein OSB04_022825 [Centaurea solstitialis]